MTVKFQVAPGHSIMGRARVNSPIASKDLLLPGTILEDGQFSVTDIESMMKSGHIIPMGGVPMMPKASGTIPGSSPDRGEDALDHTRAPEVVSGRGSASLGSSSPDGSVTANVAPIASKQPEPPVEQVQSRWVVNPESLADKDHEELLVMILERDEDYDVSTVETAEQAIAVLSADYASTMARLGKGE